MVKGFADENAVSDFFAWLFFVHVDNIDIYDNNIKERIWNECRWFIFSLKKMNYFLSGIFFC